MRGEEREPGTYYMCSFNTEKKFFFCRHTHKSRTLEAQLHTLFGEEKMRPAVITKAPYPLDIYGTSGETTSNISKTAGFC